MTELQIPEQKEHTKRMSSNTPKAIL